MKIMQMWIAVIVIIASGAIGGVFNALVIDGGFVRGGETKKDGKTIWSLGFFTNILTGAFAAFLSWGLYGSFSSINLFKPTETVELTLSAICGAALVGFSGSSWLTTQAKKDTWKEAAVKAVSVKPNPNLAAEISAQSANKALATIKNRLYEESKNSN
jgi:membrane associated rhomboid family serine protease